MKTVKMTVLAATMALASFVCQAQEIAVTLEFDNATTANEMVQKYIKALQNGDVATMSAQLADNAMVYGLGGGLDSLTVSQHTEYFKNSMATYKHAITQDLYLPVKVENNWNEGEWVLAWGTNTVTNKETGENIFIPFHSVNLVQNGKIVMMRYFYDMLNIIENQGFTITPPTE